MGYIVENRDEDGTDYDWCRECGFRVKSVTHTRHCAVGIAALDEDERIERIRELLKAE